MLGLLMQIVVNAPDHAKSAPSPSNGSNVVVWLGLACVGVAALFVLGIIGSAISAMGKPSSCSLCGNKLKRAVYPWKVEQGGKKVKQMYLCPDCNENFEKRRSKEAVEKYFGARTD